MLRWNLWLCLTALTACPGPDDPETDLTECADADADADGFASVACGGDDCDDADADVSPEALERCNGKDDDCDGSAAWEDDLACSACETAGYFGDLVAAEPSDRAAVIQDLLAPVRCSYGTATDQMFLQIDKSGGDVVCVYTGTRVPVGSEKPDGDVMNTEHTWPQSAGASREPARCDLHHLFPTRADANQARGNLPFGVVAGSPAWSDGGSKASGSVFEPRDAHKGNVGRAMLYFALRYGYELSPAERELYLDWSAGDPPNEADLARDGTIARLQGSANPFVVCPMAGADMAP